MSRRVVVTGMGIVSPLGNDLATSWDGIVHGRSGIGPITQIDASQFTTKIAGEIKNFDPTLLCPPRTSRRWIRSSTTVSAPRSWRWTIPAWKSTTAMPNAWAPSSAPASAGCSVLKSRPSNSMRRRAQDFPFYVPSTIINMLPGQVSLIKGLKGPTFSAVSACATSNHSIGTAMRMIQHGDADVMLAGGAERGSSPGSVGGFCAMKAMSTRNDDPTGASRPWDKQRDGFVLGDGAGVLVLEEYEHAKARGARIYAELVGFGASSDAFHMTAPSEDGEGAARSMAAAMRDAKLNPEQIGYLNAHGTSTPLGDLAETIAMKRALGDHAYKTMVSSTKSMTGHLLGAAGGVEAIFSVMALHTGIIPPTINLEEPSEGCDLDYVPNVAREVQVDAVMSNGFGFGGTNGTLVFKRV